MCDSRELSAVPALVASEPKRGSFALGQETDSPRLASRKASHSERAQPWWHPWGTPATRPKSGSSPHLDKSLPPFPEISLLRAPALR